MPQIEALFTSTPSVVQVTSAMGSAGQALPVTPSSSIDLARGGVGGPIQYKVGAGTWITLDANEGVNLAIDLAVTAVLLRKGTTNAAAIPVQLKVNVLNNSQASGVNVPTVVVGSAAPNNADGRPDGTVYIQTV